MQERHPNDASDSAFTDDEFSRDHRPPPGLALDPPDAPPPDHPPEIPVERLDADALKVIARLRHMHHQAYLVGGCVRDVLLGQTPKDFDVATDAHPGEVRAIFRNCRLIGRRFRLAHVYFRGGKVIEVATFRKNPTDVAEDVGEGADGDLLITRDNVFGTAEEDSVRRDFTVNGLFYDVATGEVIDYVGGRADLEAHRIATIGDPEIRMREDPVRALRAVRFAARLGFTIAPDTFEAMRRHSGELARCAPARVLEEIFKILRCGGSARAFELLRASGALPVILPALGGALEGWDPAKRRSFFAHLAALDRLVRTGEEVSEAVMLGALLMHLEPPAGRAPAGDDVEPAAPIPDEADHRSDRGRRRGSHARSHHASSTEADQLLATLVTTSRLPRKVAERTRLALHAQKLFHEPPKKRRRRGRGLAGQPHFVDAVQLLEISVEATGEGREVLERWNAAQDGAGPSERHERDDRTPRGERRHARADGPRPVPDTASSSGAAPAGRSADRRARQDRAAAEAEGVAGAVPDTELEADPDAGPLELDAEAPDDADDAADEAVPDTAEVEAGRSHGQGRGAPSEGGAGGRRRRRRRGGKRRRRRGVGHPSQGGSSGPPPAAAGGE